MKLNKDKIEMIDSFIMIIGAVLFFCSIIFGSADFGFMAGSTIFLIIAISSTLTIFITGEYHMKNGKTYLRETQPAAFYSSAIGFSLVFIGITLFLFIKINC